VARADDERIMEKLLTVYMAYQYGIGEEMELGFLGTALIILFYLCQDIFFF